MGLIWSRNSSVVPHRWPGCPAGGPLGQAVWPGCQPQGLHRGRRLLHSVIGHSEPRPRARGPIDPTYENLQRFCGPATYSVFLPLQAICKYCYHEIYCFACIAVSRTIKNIDYSIRDKYTSLLLKLLSFLLWFLYIGNLFYTPSEYGLSLKWPVVLKDDLDG